MEQPQSGPSVHKAKRRRRCSKCGSMAHDARNHAKHANGAKPQRRAVVAGAGDALERELANVRKSLRELEALKRALAACGFHPR